MKIFPVLIKNCFLKYKIKFAINFMYLRCFVFFKVKNMYMYNVSSLPCIITFVHEG